jgi:hypothetical protein
MCSLIPFDPTRCQLLVGGPTSRHVIKQVHAQLNPMEAPLKNDVCVEAASVSPFLWSVEQRAAMLEPAEGAAWVRIAARGRVTSGVRHSEVDRVGKVS